LTPYSRIGARIDARFAALKAENRAGFVAYVMAGDPDAATAAKILAGLPAAGADLIELGFPFSDPMAEGPPIQRSAQRALAAGMTLGGVFDMVRGFRKADTTTPLILMGYMNLVLHHGIAAFARDAAESGVDGLIVVDCPPEEAGPLADALDAAGVSLIRLATPTTDDERLKVVVKRTSGFVYYVSVAGVTGVKEADAAAVAPHVERVRRASGLPVAVGFGIRTPELAAGIARVADACVVGSALVDEVAKAVEMNEDVTRRVLSKANSLSKAVRSARVGQTTV
jgi:tryptophan synthase alpha chain